MKHKKKNSRRMRKKQQMLLQKNKNIQCEVKEITPEWLSMSHIVVFNPILKDTMEVKTEYLNRLKRYIKISGRDRRKYESSALKAYERIILANENVGEKHDIEFYHHYILLDMLHILGYEIKDIPIEKIGSIRKEYCMEFSRLEEKTEFEKIINAVKENERKLIALSQDSSFSQEKNYIELIRRNKAFKNKKPYKVMVTATMSAGKSTFINALAGKYVCLSQNMACTSKIHHIINKSFEDGFAYEYDHDLVLTAGKEELLKDNELNHTDKIIEAVHFDGFLNNQRIIVNDSPGVNYSGNEDHKKITDKLISKKEYDLLVYIMNATQLATDDEASHLEFVKSVIGKKPIVFVLNKIDEFNIEEEDINQTIKGLTEYLKRKGFKNPIICPMSAKAGYLSKQTKKSVLSKVERRELYNYVDKFEDMKLTDYYGKNYKKIQVDDTEKEEEQLLKTCGLAYVEKIIVKLATGGK